MKASLELNCPYCVEKWTTRADLGINAHRPTDVRCMPYTRDVNRFDPKNREDASRPGRWSQIGSDFLRAIRYDRWFGILSMQEATGQVVKYRVETCPSCNFMFDVYVSCGEASSAITLDRIWPHLFPPQRGRLHPYRRTSLPLALLGKLGFGSVTRGAALLAFIAVLHAFGPWLVGPPAVHEPLVLNAALYALAAVAIVGVARLYEGIVKAQDDLLDLQRLFEVRRQSDVAHWRNYTLCRFVGVQIEDQPPRPSQVDAISGALSVTGLIATRYFCGGLSGYGVAILFAELLCYVGGVLVLRSGWRSMPTEGSDRSSHDRGRIAVAIILFLAPAAFTLCPAWIPACRVSCPVGGMHEAADSVFWILVAYFLAVGFHLALTSIFYVLRGLTRIPLRRKDVGDRWFFKPITVFRTFAYKMILGIFSLLLVSASLIEAVRQPAILAQWPGFQAPDGALWLESWFIWVLGAVLTCLLVVSEPRIVAVLVPFAIGVMLMRDTKLYIVPRLEIGVDGRVVLLAVFLAVLFVWLARDLESNTYLLLNRTNLRSVEEIDDTLGSLRLGSDLSSAKIVAMPSSDAVAFAGLLLHLRETLVGSRRPKRWAWIGGVALTLAGVILQPLFELFLKNLTGS